LFKKDEETHPDFGKKKKKGLLRLLNYLPSTLEAPHCGERFTAV
jgi:hypothetical protein